jgi:hypothetical protein
VSWQHRCGLLDREYRGHLRVLREAGLFDVRQEAQRRVYTLRPEPLAEVDEWLGRYRALWEQRLDALHTEVARGNADEGEPDEQQRTCGYPHSGHAAIGGRYR